MTHASENNQAIVVEKLGKCFRLRKERDRTLKGTLLGVLRGRGVRNDLWALKDVNLSIRKGETFGIIGANGAGKSTLLGVLAGTIRPTEGRIDVAGRISSLLELGAGFHPDLTGRENVYLNASILGLPKATINAKFDDIVRFAGLAEFIDSPVKHYSSGMYVRLGFAVAVEVDPDVLLVDEVLAVGDEAFRKKCLGKIAEFQRAGKTIVVVSHDLDTVSKTCSRVMLLGEGRVLELGEPQAVVEEYKRLGLQQQDDVYRREWGTRAAEITDVQIVDATGAPAERFRSGETMRVRIRYEAHEPIADPVFGFSVADFQGKLCYGSNTAITGTSLGTIDGTGGVELTIEPLNLLRGKFFLSLALHSPDHQTHFHRLDHAWTFWVVSDSKAEGFVELRNTWRCLDEAT
ncbi:MAG: ABC transporter ATP-binding protein [Verrucomicrobia bacterium]|nr:ABC transporter ATP-binding protein [Verrucomicrobiota bacterium]